MWVVLFGRIMNCILQQMKYDKEHLQMKIEIISADAKCLNKNANICLNTRSHHRPTAVPHHNPSAESPFYCE